MDGDSDGDWAAMSVLERMETAYDADARPVAQRLMSPAGGGAWTTHALSQSSFDFRGRPGCTAVRMNPSEFSSPPSDACTLDTQGSFGPDRIVRTSYDAAGQMVLVESGVGTAAHADEMAATYTSNGRIETLTDGEDNRTTYEYDEFDRLAKTRLPVTTQGADQSSTTDYEQLTYDAAGNVYAGNAQTGINALGRLPASFHVSEGNTGAVPFGETVSGSGCVG